jgi:hypothetical protein
MTTKNNENIQEELFITIPNLHVTQTLYAIMNDKGEIVSVNNRRVHLTRKDVRAARDLYNRRNAKIVKGNFALGTNWTPIR